MGWFGKGKKDKSRQAGEKPAAVKAGAKPSSEDIRAQALANARAARERIGDETIQKIAAALQKKQNSPIEQAKMKIAETDADRVAEEILSMLETRH